jgi:hypothetical protein
LLNYNRAHISADRSNSCEFLVAGRGLFVEHDPPGAPTHPAETSGNGASALSQRASEEGKREVEDRKRRFDDSVHVDGKENFIHDKVDLVFRQKHDMQIGEEERRPVRQPPLGVVRTLCREAAESRFLHRSEGYIRMQNVYHAYYM